MIRRPPMSTFRPTHTDVADLRHRAHTAMQASAAAKLRSAELVEDAEATVRRGYTLECAWCGRVAGVDGFLEGERAFGHVRRRVTHGICPSCLGDLRKAGLTR